MKWKGQPTVPPGYSTRPLPLNHSPDYDLVKDVALDQLSRQPELNPCTLREPGIMYPFRRPPAMDGQVKRGRKRKGEIELQLNLEGNMRAIEREKGGNNTTTNSKEKEEKQE